MQALFLIAALIAVSGCSDDDTTAPSKAGTFYGPPVAVGNGTAKAFVKWDDAGNPSSIGISFTEAALTNLPPDSMGTQYVLSLPSQASATAFNHVLMDWNPGGHEPMGIYTLPHFDFHFYLVSQQERASVIPGPDTVPVPSQYVPAGYTYGPAPIAVPNMGVHYIDPTSPEFQGQTFTKTFIYGYYQGKMTFMEPMITKAVFEGKTNSTTDIKLPSAFQMTGKYYPTKYSITYDAAAKEFSVSLDAMVMR